MEDTHKHTILIVDDSPESVDVLREVLRNKYQLKAALNGSDALKIAASPQTLDLILLDIAMPDMNGYQVSEQLKANPSTRDIPIIFVSAMGETLDKVCAFNAGCVDYITKPIEPEEVLVRVRTHLELSDLHRSVKKEIDLRKQAEAALKQANETLEKRVQERTMELAAANTHLKKEIQERIKIAQEKEELLEHVRNLAHYQQSIVEEERTMIAREMHDEFGQNLTALKMDTAWLARQVPEGSSQLLERLSGMSLLLDDTIQLVRRVARDLRPRVLDELGLLAALEWQVQEFTTRTGIPCELSLKSEATSFGRDLDTTIFHICQEALTNIIRHAEASQVWVKLKTRAGNIEFSVEDNGRGISAEQIANSNSFGLLGMRERVRIWHGEISLGGVPGRGTRLKVRIPIGNQQRGANDPGSYRR